MGREEPQDFWSRRRAGVQAEEAAEAARAADEVRQPADQAAAPEDRSDAEILEELGLSDPDTLQQGDDFTGFLKSAVPEHLRRRALRRLWRSNPVLANLDGLVDHGEDFSDAATVVPGMKTTYQVGKGMLKHVLAQAKKALAEAEAEIEVETETEVEVKSEIALAEVADEPEGDFAPVAVELETDGPETDGPEAPAPRRHMRFAFTGEAAHG